ncbi:MAG: DUF1906 domain-containing protein [Maricaulaceae bacterium]|jgi:hypothetical protein
MPSPISRRQLLRTSGGAGLAALSAGALAGCETTSASSGGAPSAPSTGFPQIADTATRLDAAKVASLRDAGVKTVFRYYCHLPPSLPEKDLTPDEARTILDGGLSIGAVFQHYNNCFRTFENRWGPEDAAQALTQAAAVGQPRGSAIYFGVDGDWPYQEMVDPVLAYFEAVNEAFEGSGIDVGVYSNGCICNAVAERGLASYFWLSGSTAHTGTQAFYNLGGWTLFQNALDITLPGGFPIDANLVNPARGGYFGQFDARGAQTAAHAASDVSALFNGRRFLAANADLKAAPDPASATLASVRKDRNVRVLENSGGWSRVRTQEGGTSAGGASVDGWVATAALTSMERFPDGTTAYGLCGSSSSPTDDYKYQSCARATFRNR